MFVALHLLDTVAGKPRLFRQVILSDFQLLPFTGYGFIQEFAHMGEEPVGISGFRHFPTPPDKRIHKSGGFVSQTLLAQTGIVPANLASPSNSEQLFDGKGSLVYIVCMECGPNKILFCP